MEDKVSIINKTTERTILFYEIFTFILYWHLYYYYLFIYFKLGVITKHIFVSLFV